MGMIPIYASFGWLYTSAGIALPIFVYIDIIIR